MDLDAALQRVVRSERPRVIASLYRACGSLDQAEDAFQEAIVTATASWPKSGLPENPVAWVTTVAKNHLRQAQRHATLAQSKAGLIQEEDAVDPAAGEAVSDEQLRLIFTCCHPALGPEAQVALTLKVVLGFSVEELARAFLVPEPTMAQRLVRAKRQIEEERLGVAPPGRRDLDDRLAAVLAVVYLVFTEGHTSRAGPLMRVDLQAEALRLGRLLTELLPTEPEVFGLYALVAFSAARASTRVDGEGLPLLLSEQARSRWSGELILEGLMALQRAQRLGGGAYTLQAEIASWHCTAPTWEATEWTRILTAYDRLLALSGSPVVAMNRAVAVMMAQGPQAGLEALAPLEDQLSRYHLFYATRADFLRRAGLPSEADDQRALELATNDGERELLRRRLKRSL